MNTFLIIISSILFFLFILILVLYIRCKKYNLYTYSNKEKNKIKSEIDEYTNNYKKNADKTINELNSNIHQLVLKQNQEQLLLNKEKEKRQLLIAEQTKHIDAEVQNYKDHKQKEIEHQLNEERLRLFKQSEEILNQYIDNANKKRDSMNAEIEAIKISLEDFRAKRASINEIIRKEEEIENEEESHSILLSKDDKEDIEFLLSIEPKVHNKEVLRKLIWSTYISKPFTDMINRQFGSNIPKCVIYCIERKDNHKKYIGKTVAEVNKRWTEHFKSSLNIGTISHQKIHEALFGHWDEFLFSVIEIVDKDQINEREKYYIKFFESDIYGYNIKKG